MTDASIVDRTRESLADFERERRQNARLFAARWCAYHNRAQAVGALDTLLDEVYGRAFVEGMIFQQGQTDG